MTKPTSSRVRAVEKAVHGDGVKIETLVDLKAERTRFEERVEGGKKIITMILNKDDAAIL